MQYHHGTWTQINGISWAPDYTLLCFGICNGRDRGSGSDYEALQMLCNFFLSHPLIPICEARCLLFYVWRVKSQNVRLQWLKVQYFMLGQNMMTLTQTRQDIKNSSELTSMMRACGLQSIGGKSMDFKQLLLSDGDIRRSKDNNSNGCTDDAGAS